LLSLGKKINASALDSNLYAFERDIRKQLQQEKADWRVVL